MLHYPVRERGLSTSRLSKILYGPDWRSMEPSMRPWAGRQISASNLMSKLHTSSFPPLTSQPPPQLISSTNMHPILLSLTLILLLPYSLAQFSNFFPFGQNPFSGGQRQQEQQPSSGSRAHKGWAEYESGKLESLPRSPEDRLALIGILGSSLSCWICLSDEFGVCAYPC